MKNAWILSRILLVTGVSVFPWVAQSAVSPTIVVRGDVAAALTLGSKDVTGMPRATVSVTEKDGTKVSYEGVPLVEVLKRAGVPLGKELRGKALASYILAKGRDAYEVVFSVGEMDSSFGNEVIVLADKRDGKALPDAMGPFRIVCPTTRQERARFGCWDR